MAVLFKILASSLVVAALTKGAFGAPEVATGTRSSSGTTWQDPLGSSSINSVTDPKRDVALVDPIPSEIPSTSSIPHSNCPGAYDSPSDNTIILLQTRADQLSSEFKTPRLSVVEALGEENVRRLQTKFAVASVGFRGLVPVASRLASEGDLSCVDHTRMLRMYTERNARLTKSVADAYGVMASKVREAITKMGTDANSGLQLAADEYDNLRASYLEAHERAERQRVAAAKLPTDEDGLTASQTSGVLTSNELTRPSSGSLQAV